MGRVSARRGPRLSPLAFGAVLALVAVVASPPARAEVDAALDDEDRPVDTPEVARFRAAQAEAIEKAPSGPRIVLAQRRAPRAVRACSPRLPLCVHADTPSAATAILASLAALERAWDTLTGALRLPAPDVDLASLTYDVVLEPDVPGGWDTRPVARDARSTFDRASAESSIDIRSRAGCALDTAAFRALARASLYRVAPAATDGVARAQVAYLSELAVPCSIALAAPEAQAFQTSPDRAVADARTGETGAAAGDPSLGPHRARDPQSRLFADGAALFWARLDWAFGKNPGDVVRASWTLAPTATKPGAERWANEPDAFDVLRVSFKGTMSTGSTVSDALLDVAIARAFMGGADDGVHQPETRVLGDAGGVAFDWDIVWPAKPKRLAPRAPVAPTGSSYVLVRTANARAGARLRLEADWEEHALFRWAVIKIDREGHETARLVVPTRERALEAQMTVVDLAGVDRVLVVAVNAGDPAYPFDPDDEVWEPHGWLLTLAEE